MPCLSFSRNQSLVMDICIYVDVCYYYFLGARFHHDTPLCIRISMARDTSRCVSSSSKAFTRSPPLNSGYCVLNSSFTHRQSPAVCTRPSSAYTASSSVPNPFIALCSAAATSAVSFADSCRAGDGIVFASAPLPPSAAGVADVRGPRAPSSLMPFFLRMALHLSSCGSLRRASISVSRLSPWNCGRLLNSCFTLYHSCRVPIPLSTSYTRSAAEASDGAAASAACRTIAWSSRLSRPPPPPPPLLLLPPPRTMPRVRSSARQRSISSSPSSSSKAATTSPLCVDGCRRRNCCCTASHAPCEPILSMTANTALSSVSAPDSAWCSASARCAGDGSADAADAAGDGDGGAAATKETPLAARTSAALAISFVLSSSSSARSRLPPWKPGNAFLKANTTSSHSRWLLTAPSTL
eukprot:Rhum_TRINITY_DN7601_c0_g1::Rhum_TRINITY_DN7601_c0_g1_i1::g.23740::m.23740